MKGSFNPTCDRHGHMLTGVGSSPQLMAPFVCPTAEEIALDSPSETWSTSEVLDELVRKADCPVMAEKANPRTASPEAKREDCK